MDALLSRGNFKNNNTKKIAMKLIFRIGDTLQVISKSTTSNDKIESDKKRKIVQTYTFSRKQFELIANGTNDGMKTFFNNADTNCLDCPFNEFGKCYTHKFNQYVGFISSYTNDATEWLEDWKEDQHKVGSILEFICTNEQFEEPWDISDSHISLFYEQEIYQYERTNFSD